MPVIPASVPPKQFSEKYRKIVALMRYVLVGMLVTTVLVVVKLYVERTDFGHRVELLTYEFLHGQIPAFSREVEMPVVVLDISNISGGKGKAVTPRLPLKQVLEELVRQKARAIAVDIDFSPNSSGWMDKDDPSFFQFCEELEKSGVPIVLGVYRTRSRKADVWLGDPEFKTLAADMTIDTRDTSRMRLWVRYGQEETLPSISSALINKEGLSLVPAPKWLQFLLQDRVQITTDNDNGFTAGLVRVNYSKLEVLQAESLSTTSKQSVAELGDKFRNKFVIIGDASESTDTFVVPGRFVSVAGVYLHACNVYSLTVEPFFELKQSYRMGIDFGLAFLLLMIIAVIRWSRWNEAFDWHRKQRRLIWWFAGLAVLGGILAVRLLDVLWLDFVLVLFVLFLHPSMEKRLRNLLHLTEDN